MLIHRKGAQLSGVRQPPGYVSAQVPLAACSGHPHQAVEHIVWVTQEVQHMVWVNQAVEHTEWETKIGAALGVGNPSGSAICPVLLQGPMLLQGPVLLQAG